MPHDPVRVFVGEHFGRVRDVRLQKNLSDTRCVRNDNWGIDRRGIWVDRGCAARFTIY